MAEARAIRQAVRCAVYTRKSTEEGLDQEFNSLQAQREACEAFITSQRHEGWACRCARTSIERVNPFLDRPRMPGARPLFR